MVRVLLSAFAFIVLVVAVWIGVFGWGSVRIVNRTGDPIASGAVEAFGQYYKVPGIPPGRSHRVFYLIDGEGSSALLLKMASGRLVCGGNGYIDPLWRRNDVFVVTPTGSRLNDMAEASAPTNCVADRPARELAVFGGWRPGAGSRPK